MCLNITEVRTRVKRPPLSDKPQENTNLIVRILILDEAE